MSTTIKSGASFVAAILVVFGGIYLMDRYGDWRPFADRKPIQEIPGSVGPITAIDDSRSTGDAPSDRATASADPARARPKENAVFRCEHHGQVTYSDEPCEGSSTSEVRTSDSAGIRIVDPGEVDRFRQQALASKPIAESKPAPALPAKASVRAQCDQWEKYIKELDVRALRPLSGSEQDRIKQARKNIREKMFDLDCMHA